MWRLRSRSTPAPELLSLPTGVVRSVERPIGWFGAGFHGRAQPIGRGTGLTPVDAVEDGWFYTGPLPEKRRVLAFLTGADLAAAVIARNTACLVEAAGATREIRAILTECGFVPIGGGVTAALSSVLKPCAAGGSLAAGDASLSFDPLSSQGLVHTLFTGLAAAQTADAYLLGDHKAVLQYRQLMDGIQRAYHEYLALCYASETRWPSSPFWKRRKTSDRDTLVIGSPRKRRRPHCQPPTFDLRVRCRRLLRRL